MGGPAGKMVFAYTLVFSLVTLVTEASVASDCMRFLLDDEFRVHCATLGSTTTKPCLVSTTEDHDYLQRYGIVSNPETSKGQMICSRKGDLHDVDCVSTKMHSSNKIDWMWTEWVSIPGYMVSRTMYYTDNGVTKHCPYQETKPAPPIVLVYAIDDEGEAHADGVLVSTNSGWDTVKTVELHPATRLIAFKVINRGSVGGVRAWLSIGLITYTNRGWKCSVVYEEGWNQVGFDDSHWGEVTIGYNFGYHVGHSAVNIVCGSNGVGTFYFRRMLPA